MEIKTCEEYVLRELENAHNEIDFLKRKVKELETIINSHNLLFAQENESE